MATNSSAATQAQIQQQQQQQQKQQHFQTTGSPHHCKECGLFLNSAESLEVHLQYHKENLLNKWATQGASHSEETNNNTTSANSKALCIKREFVGTNTISAAADSSDAMFKNNSRASPEIILGHPPTPQSYNSASSPYQNHENSFSPGFQSYQSIKTEPSSPNNFQQQQSYHQNYHDSQYFMESSQMQQHNYSQDYSVHKLPNQSSYRYHPYHQQVYERNSQAQVSSSSPVYPPQPTPSPSPKQCDKCGYVCESASQLIEHLNVSHPPTPSTHLQSYQPNRQFMFGNHHQHHHHQQQIKSETDSQSEILDLDSHKVHQVFPEEDKQQQNNGEDNVHNPHSVSTMLSSWNHHHVRQNPFVDGADQSKAYQQNGMAPPDQKLFRAQQMAGMNEYMPAGVTTTTEDGSRSGNLNTQQTYRPFEHMAPTPSGPVISSSQIPTPPTVASAPVQTKGANWKSNEARRPKTYNCTACNKWFTSSGHLKRHYNTTLHKNAVKSSGQPDPATLPISAHHHPARDAINRNDDQSPDPMDDQRSEDRSFERPPSIPSILQQSPGNPYERSSLHNPGMQSPINTLSNHNSLSNSSISNLSSTSPPNGEAGPSAISNLDTRGLLSLPSTPSSPFTSPIHQYMASPSHHMMQSMDNTFQMYPNGSAPHVMQVTATSSHSTTGELMMATDSQPLPSFAQIQAHRFGLLLGYGAANVGGMGPATGPYATATATFYHDPYNNTLNGDNMRTLITACRPIFEDQISPDLKASLPEDVPYSPPNHNNNSVHIQSIPEETDSKIHLLENMKTELEPSRAPSPKQKRVKLDYEDTTSSPLITSTVQSKQSGVLHKCFDCDKMFNRACYLTQHNKTFHSGDKPFKCTRCGKRFSCEKQYQNHSTKHAGDKPYKCDLCPKQFNHKTDLRRHMCLHTGQKPFACDTCGKGFIRKDHMLKHCDTHSRRPASKVATVR
ncbi:putative uncharacterized protein DDB_G0291608 [Agrilus planipennis]|uniref:C2H2-type domain-containing protein n=1 Tax=Agrilus planipennis TaxID=224129 RepID=A0A1W4X9V3_AGRPL|nr:putative uncharacterized protein DDB_G0291608 [Agrilus planipennis]